MIHGIQHLIALRKSGRRPAFLEVDVDCPYLEPRYANEFARMVLVAEGDLRLDDFRPFVGLAAVLPTVLATLSLGDGSVFSALLLKMLQYPRQTTSVRR